tara:strand:- start:27564 stop:28346 length:783 start_codon:yes stop_codon:yes gene_type:complete
MSYQITNTIKIHFIIYIFLFCVFLISVTSCRPNNKALTAQQIIDKSIKISGVGKLNNSFLSFEFRNKYYTAFRSKGQFKLKRIFTLDDLIYEDILMNTGFNRFINSYPKQIPDSMAIKYTESVNSVHYFSVLPYGLNDEAVKKILLKDTRIKGKDYYKVQITFSKENGGVDFDDVFIYWVAKNDFKIDYLAYTFHVNGGGKRFREVRKEHYVNGIRFLDYNNFKPKNNNAKLSTLDKAFQGNELIKASEINLEKIKVTIN